MYRLFICSVLLLQFLFTGCKTARETTKLTIASERRDCTGVGPMKCFLVKIDGKGDWTFMYDQIEGFDYEPGYEYVIEVREETIDNPPADRASFKYVFERQVSKVKKTSEDMPEMPLIR